MRHKHLIVRSRNKSCRDLRKIDTFDKTVVYRMGSTTPLEQIFPKGYNDVIQINSIEGCRISSDKRLMKQYFKEAGVRTANYETLDIVAELGKKELEKRLNAPWIIKKYNSSKGKGIYKIDDWADLQQFIIQHSRDLKLYIVEEYKYYVREYRLHVDHNGCFYACRKMLKNDAEVRWHRHENNSVWILEENEQFDKPTNWNEIVAECKYVLDVMHLDIAAFDIKVQSSNIKNPKFIILETNTAPALGEIGLQKYKEELNKLINE